MTAPGEHDDWARRAKERFDESVERLDAATLSRLKRARREALEAASSRRDRALRPWLPATGVVAALALVALLVRGPEPALPPVPEPAEGDVLLLLGEDHLEMLEDFEFYYWIDELRADAGNARG
jgi:hypothetical protein